MSEHGGIPRAGNAANSPWGIAGGGLTKLEWFAGMAMIGELASQDIRSDGKGTGIIKNPTEAAYRMFNLAAAMVAESDRRSQP